VRASERGERGSDRLMAAGGRTPRGEPRLEQGGGAGADTGQSAH
jgi:hypothetical protein